MEDPTDCKTAYFFLWVISFFWYASGAGDLLLVGSVKGYAAAFLPIRAVLSTEEPNC